MQNVYVDLDRSLLEVVTREPMKLWVYTPHALWKHDHSMLLFLNFITRRGYEGKIVRWKALQSTASEQRVWGRVDWMSREFRTQRTLEGEIARALWGFHTWGVVANQCLQALNRFHGNPFAPTIDLQLLPFCRDCGTPTSRWCSSCNMHNRQGLWQTALCDECDSPGEAACTYCRGGIRGTVARF